MALDPASTKDIIVKRHDKVVFHQHCPDRPYLELEIPADFGEAHYVEFTVESRDQGWTSVSVNNSWSWFDATIRRPHGRNNVRPLHLFDNELAKPEFSEHSLRIVPDHPWGVNWKPWIKSLRPGDVIELMPRAMYVCWLNVVRRARIELRYEAVKIDASTPIDESLPAHAKGDLFARRLDAEAREIRVLSLQPGSFDDPIECHISYVKLGLPPGERQDFDALSYSWGDDRERVEIDVQQGEGDGMNKITKVNITRPAHTALKHLRDKSLVLNLWIDIVCIDQDNLEERAQQVGMMASIFAEAKTVHVWLGLHPGIESALLIIRDIHNLMSETCAGRDSCLCRGTPHTLLSDLQDSAKQRQDFKDSHKDWPAKKNAAIYAVFDLHFNRFTHEPREYAGGLSSPHVSKLMSHLFETPWFRRVWVIQEVLKAQDVLVHCGKETIEWTEFSIVSDWLGDQHFKTAQPHVQLGQAMIPLIWQSLAPSSNAVESATPGDSSVVTHIHKQPGILDVFLASLDLKSKEARDKLFAVLSFGRETSDNENLPILVQPDYNKSTELVFADFTRWWIMEHRSLSVLSYIHSDRTRTWLRMLCDTAPIPPISKPSWAIPMDGKHTWAQATLEARFSFRATGQTVPDAALLGDHSSSETDRKTLKLSGYTIGAIKRTGSMFVQKGFSTSDQHQQQMMDVVNEILDPANVNECWQSRQVTDPKANLKSFQSRLEDHLRSHHFEDVPRQLAVINPFSTSKRRARKQLQPQVGSCTDPFCFVASNGMLGLCPWRAREGDVIVLLLGGNVPFLLRPCKDGERGAGGEAFELVGECFVMGIMDGDLMQKLQKEGSKPQIFNLI